MAAVSYYPQPNLPHRPGSSSSSFSFDSVHSASENDEDATVTITANNRTLKRTKKQRSAEDLRVLAISAQITEVSYSISDIQTRIFEIQELRHQDLGISNGASSKGPAASSSSTGVIDQALIHLDERLEAVSKSVNLIEDTLEPLLRAFQNMNLDQSHSSENGADILILRKHAALLAEWEGVQNEAENLRDELKEDKWLAVFRNASEQADGMMASLDKAASQCHEFVLQVRRQRAREAELSRSSFASTSTWSEKGGVSLEVYNELLKSFEAKKKYYMPSTTKVLSVLDKGVRDRVTKNGECLRRHADMRAKWRNLRERISTIDAEMEKVRKLLDGDFSDDASISTVSRGTAKSREGHAALNESVRSLGSSTSGTLARSMSPLKRFAAKMTGKSPKVSPPVPAPAVGPPPRTPPTDRTLRRRTSFFPLRNADTASRHKANSSVDHLNPPILPRHSPPSDEQTLRGKKPPWNISTRVEPEPYQTATIKPNTSRRAPTPSPASSRVTQASYSSSAFDSTHTLPSPTIWTTPPSTNGRDAFNASRGSLEPPMGRNFTPRTRPTTPSYIPSPAYSRASVSQVSVTSSEDQDVTPTSLMQRAMSPSFSATRSVRSTPLKSRRPSNSLIPAPRLSVSGASRATSPTMSHERSASPSLSASSSAISPATPETGPRSRVGATPVPQYPFLSTPPSRPGPRPSLGKGRPPSSYKESSPNVSSSRPGSRPSSRVTSYDRSTVFTPSLDQNPVIQYVPMSLKDPLDVEVARVVNSIAHGFLIERIDPPLRAAPPPGAEIKAQYAISNALGRKVINCRLVVINRSGSRPEGQTKKVMCRVGGGWLDLHMYLLNRQAGVA
ncbi:hypothetical protein BOTBODRAFT_39301 [Botryobasidium botryosum FD-172 SS1]|uniref:GAR domain-containing protein n=1 Tax=Botryobasidium botryosum (strain FD-172 SS1) TaxID=930990 RepID=A0A067LUV0_BOTB1|nr:hypothetical protein BOTBODRAFT_39301 [Botryobasidium botryosum FD-172 SS1]